VSWTIERRRRVAVVTMNTKVNAQNRTFFADLHDAFNRLEADYPESPVVLTGGPRVSAGLDLVASTSHCSPADDRRREASLRVPHRPPTGGSKSAASALAGWAPRSAQDAAPVGLGAAGPSAPLSATAALDR
jgi:hypothetical protein